jgi:hypothetical protein
MTTNKCKFCGENALVIEDTLYVNCDSCKSTIKMDSKKESNEIIKEKQNSLMTQGKKFEYDINKPIYHWASFPFVDKPKHTIVLCLIIFIITYLLWELTVNKWQQPLYYFLGIFMLFIGIVPYFVPTRYYFFEDGIVILYPIAKIEKLYSSFGCFYIDKHGIMLSSFKQPRRLDSFRGQSIRFSKTADERESIIMFLKEKVGKQY